MAHPTVFATNSSIKTGASSSHVVSLASGSAAGDLLIVFFGHSGGFSAPTWPGGWTQKQYSDANNIGADWGYRYADGTEGSTITLTGPTNESAHFCYCIRGHNRNQGPESQAFWDSGVGSAASTGSVTPTGGSKEYLWLIACAADSGFVATAAPSPYTNLLTSDSGSTANVSAAVSVARHQSKSSVESAGNFTLEGSEGWLGIIVAVHPPPQAVPRFAPVPFIPEGRSF